jgi:hypothetical protein
MRGGRASSARLVASQKPEEPKSFAPSPPTARYVASPAFEQGSVHILGMLTFHPGADGMDCLRDSQVCRYRRARPNGAEIGRAFCSHRVYALFTRNLGGSTGGVASIRPAASAQRTILGSEAVRDSVRRYDGVPECDLVVIFRGRAMTISCRDYDQAVTCSASQASRTVPDTPPRRRPALSRTRRDRRRC